jgi:hypothetical protein
LSNYAIKDNPLDIEALIDSGALQCNYVNKKIADWLNQNGVKIESKNNLVCSAFNDDKSCRKF